MRKKKKRRQFYSIIAGKLDSYRRRPGDEVELFGSEYKMTENLTMGKPLSKNMGRTARIQLNVWRTPLSPNLPINRQLKNELNINGSKHVLVCYY